MQELFEIFEYKGIGNDLKWVGQIRPTKSSRLYTVEITYLVGRGRPRVRVLEPSLVDSIPMSTTHRFADGTLCLHTHDQWAKDKFVAEHVIPWIPLWLTYYEGWLITGEWEGGGMHPSASNK